MLGHKTSLNKFKKIEIISSIFSNHNGVKLEINYKKKFLKYTNKWRLNDMVVNNAWVNNKTKKKIKRYSEIKENKTQQPKLYGTQ